MDQAVDTHYLTREFLEAQLVANTERIKQLESAHSQIVQRDWDTKAQLQTMIDSMQSWTINALQERLISETDAEEIAEICGFELAKDVEVEVSVTYTMTVNVGPHDEIEDVINNISFDSIDYDTDQITWLNATVDRIDF